MDRQGKEGRDTGLDGLSTHSRHFEPSRREARRARRFLASVQDKQWEQIRRNLAIEIASLSCMLTTTHVNGSSASDLLRRLRTPASDADAVVAARHTRARLG